MTLQISSMTLPGWLGLELLGETFGLQWPS
jgi:hypothetical protein